MKFSRKTNSNVSSKGEEWINKAQQVSSEVFIEEREREREERERLRTKEYEECEGGDDEKFIQRFK